MTEKYFVHEIFESIQGEGGNTGTGMLFVRFSGCNLNCPFCDTPETKIVGFLHTPMTFAALVDRIKVSRQKWVCFTGGEPCLQVDKDLIDAVDAAGKKIAVETNGTIFREEFARFSYITISPKAHVVDPRWFAEARVNEMRFLVNAVGGFVGEPPEAFSHRVDRIYLSPEFEGVRNPNAGALKAAVRMVLSNPAYRLSVQVHKWLNIR